MSYRKQSGKNKTLFLTACLLGIYLALVAMGFGPYITDSAASRQTQTAITARYLSGLADLLAYQTPVVGPPWSIPFEFPLYQALAKGLHVIAGASLESSGRLVSVAFFLLCFWPLHSLLRAWNVRETPWVMASVLLAPLYVFWSRAFMIETMALFFSLLYLAFFVRLLKAPRADAAGLLALTTAGALAGLVKITTLLPLLLVTGSVTAWLALHALRRRQPLAGLAGLALVHGVVMAVASAWVAHTDVVKVLNPIGATLTSTALREWNFGSLAQRLDPAVWGSLAVSTAEIFFPFPPPEYSRLMTALKVVLATGWLTLFAYFLVRCPPERRRQVAALCFLFVLPFALFTNLHWRHSYYQVANGLFLCLAFGLAAYGAHEAASDARGAALVLRFYAAALLSFALCSLWQFRHYDSHEGKLLKVSALVRQASAPDSVIVASGLDWSAMLPYQASRRALMLPRWADPGTVTAALASLRESKQPVSLYVECGTLTPLSVQLRQALALDDSKAFAHAEDCAIYRL